MRLDKYLKVSRLIKRRSVAKEVADRSASTVGEAANIFAKGLLMGARGNSGVITSQLFRGFSQSVKDKDELDGAALAAAFQAGVEVAYKANMVKTSYHDIRNMVEMAKLITHPHKQAFPALEYLWEADVFKLP